MSRPVHAVSEARREMLKDLFLEALDVPVARRAAFLDALTQLTMEERAELSRLIQYDETAENFFGQLSREVGSLASAECAFLPEDLVAGRFRIRRFIARGGMGEVYEADDLELKDRVALKVLRPVLARDERFVERFRREIRLTRGISSPHVCRVYDVARHSVPDRPDAVFFTMEMLDGETLAAKLHRDGTLKLDDIRRIVGEILDGLSAAHQVGILHRDLKSSNIILSLGVRGVRTVITDFGIARTVTDAQDDQTATPAYAAPEQLLGKPQTAASDIFALGVLLYELTTGSLPFKGTDRALPAPPRSLRPELSLQWQRAILRCLMPKADERFSSVGDVSRALGYLSEDRPNMGRRAAVGVVLAGMTGLGSALGWRHWWASPAPPVIAVMPLEWNTKVSEEQIQLAGGLADRIADLLYKLSEIRVVSRSASQQALEKINDKFRAAHSMGASHLFTGRMESSGSLAKVRLELAEVGTRSELWSQTTDVGFEDLEGTYREAIVAIVKVLHLSRTASAQGSAITTSQRAYENFIKARFLLEQRQFAVAELALGLIDEALSADPNFGGAHALRGIALEFLSARDGAERPKLLEESHQSAQRALRIDPRCAEAYTVLAMNQQYWKWDRAGAEANFRHAIECAPGAAFTHHNYTKHLYGLERHAEALREIDLAATLDPFSTGIKITRGYSLLYAGRTNEAVAQHRQIVLNEPARATGYIPLSDSYAAKDDNRAAIDAARKGVHYSKRASFALSQLGFTLAAERQDTEAREILAELISRHEAARSKANEVAAVYAGWKDRDRTLEWLERGLPSRDVELSTLRVAIPYRFLRGAPRFHELLKTVGFQI